MNKNRLSYHVLKEIGFTLLAEGKTIKIMADGYSMYPSIKPGSIIHIEPSDPAAGYVPGEIIACKQNNGFIVHRLIRINEKDNGTMYVTRGDSCLKEDSPVSGMQIAGRVVSMERPDGKTVTTKIHSLEAIEYKINRLKVLLLINSKKIRRIFINERKN